MKMITIRLLAAALLAAILVSTAWAAKAPPPILEPSPGRYPGKESLDWAFVFASSLHTDRKDMGKAQAAATMAYAEIGALDVATDRADRIHGWRRGVAYADLAKEAAKAGNASVARTLVGKADAFRKTVTGWEGKRIEAHIADALAVLGDLAGSERLATDLAANDPRQYTGRAAASIAVGHASRGEFDQALAELGKLDGQEDFDIAWWRTLGYLEAARSAKLDEGQRLQALERASRSADGVAGWKRAEGKLEVASDYLDLGKRELAATTVDVAETAVLEFGDHNPVKPTFLGRVAELRHRLGETERARRLLGTAMQLVPHQLVIDIPGIYASLAASYARIGDPAEAASVFDRAVTAAQGLENARPRVLSMTSICVQLGLSETVLDADRRARFQQIYAGLDDPW